MPSRTTARTNTRFTFTLKVVTSSRELISCVGVLAVCEGVAGTLAAWGGVVWSAATGALAVWEGAGVLDGDEVCAATRTDSKTKAASSRRTQIPSEVGSHLASRIDDITGPRLAQTQAVLAAPSISENGQTRQTCSLEAEEVYKLPCSAMPSKSRQTNIDVVSILSNWICHPERREKCLSKVEGGCF